MSPSEPSLFSSPSGHAPLPDRMRPRNLNEFIGQDHILAEGRLLRRAIQADRLSSVIFSGPPGTGKTTLARVIANTTKRAFTSLNAVLGGVAEVRAAIQQAKEVRSMYDRSTILFVDEVHRWNKSQQDALLPWVENGTVIFIGATTENPYFAVNSALVSRSRIFQLQPLNTAQLHQVARQALSDPQRGYGTYRVTIDDEALDHLVHVADGDARTLLGALELAVETTPDHFPPEAGEAIHVTLQVAEESIQRKAVLYDREGDYHYDTISAFIKSVRGSDPDAALYWMSRMVYAGEDPRYILRRMLILACEDVGLADPHALSIVNAASQAFERVGMPEGQYFLTHAVLYLSTAPKSNSSLGYFDALKAVEHEAQFDVPNHLKDPSRDKHCFGHGQGYSYPHAYREHWVAQEYLPSGLKGKIFYQPGREGYEGSIYTSVHRRREIQLSLHTSRSFPEILTYSPKNDGREAWIQRVLRSGAAHLHQLRDTIWAELSPQRHHRILVLGSHTPILAGEAVRSCPEGGVAVLPRTGTEQEFLQHMAAELPEVDRPLILAAPAGSSDAVNDPADDVTGLLPEQLPFACDRIAALNLLIEQKDKAAASARLRELCAPDARLVLAELYPAAGSTLSGLLLEHHSDVPEAVLAGLQAAEQEVYRDPDDPRTDWTPESLESLMRASGWTSVEVQQHRVSEPRVLSAEVIAGWLGLHQPSRFSTALQRHLDPGQLKTLRELLQSTLTDTPITWHMNFVFLAAQS
ncbi:AAA family ATPase [Spirochaeta africana]|uniref:Replication-associated recombination protein A n=1 Tax=Spirochaeta africana (strain ATCC 700263 / DSM 8902 / Z-7692) TaxID=889378 RepID=H9UI83_SPIAZ|nr:AAA family ATPase [Spirochaeta africana]AFG37226.1 AAA ATPase [Spirochaeta africana DSM 8902]